MKYKYFLIILIFTQSCYKEDFDPHYKNLIKRNELTSFSLEVQNNPSRILEDVNFTIEHNKITAFIPYYLQKDSLVATFTTNGENVYLNDILQISGETINDFTKPVTYIVEAKDGTQQGYILDLVIFTKLPILHIITLEGAPILNKEDEVLGYMYLDPNNIHKASVDGELEIKGRGNSTWLKFPKKSYKIKLKNDLKVLGMPENKHWVLLANYSDKTLLRNHIAFEISKQLNFAYTPRSEFVELFINGEYLGNHQLTEHVRTGKERINITNLDIGDNSDPQISGGYFLEIDSRAGEEVCFRTDLIRVPFCIKSPDNISTEQLDYIQNYLNTLEQVLYSEIFTDPEIGYRKYIDVDSFVDWYIINELSKSTDAAFHTSVFLFKVRNKKLTMGPVWDYDIAFGNVYYNNNYKTDGWWIRSSKWIHRLIEDPYFDKKVKDRWNEVKQNFSGELFEEINKTSEYLNFSQQRNFERWPILDKYVWPNAIVTDSYEQEVQYLKNWLEERINWLDSELNKLYP